MLYLDKLVMLAVLGFGLVLAWMTVPPSNFQAHAIEARPVEDGNVLGAAYEFKVPGDADKVCAGACRIDNTIVSNRDMSDNQSKQFERAMQAAYSAFVTPIHR